MKDSEVLKHARTLIYNDIERFLCHAIYEVSNTTKEQRKSLRSWINKLLGEHSSLDSWLGLDNYTNFEDAMNNCIKVKKMRLEWIDWMINYCEEEENN